MLRFLSFLAVIFGVQSASAPFITPCKSGDSACTARSAQAAIPFIAPGVPELGIKPMDPMHLDLVQGDTAGLQLILKNTDVTGMKNCKVESVKHDLVKAKQSITLKCSVQLNGDYILDGQILVLPIKGNGKYIIDIRDIVIKANTELDFVQGSDGKEHWHIKSWKHSYQTKGNAHFTFKNLFNGNKVLAGTVEDFLNNNWSDIMKEIAPPIVRSIVEVVVDGVEALYKAVPSEELKVAA